MHYHSRDNPQTRKYEMEQAMKSKYLVLVIISMVTQMFACNFPVSSGDRGIPLPTTLETGMPSPLTAETMASTSPAITEASANPSSITIVGTISQIRTQVYAGILGNLILIDSEAELGNDEFVQVKNGGKARLNFPGPISLLLYNQSEMDKIKLEFESNSNPRIVNRLIRGGVSGYVEPGNQLTIELSIGVKINVLGTNFFVIFDEEKGIATIGKFDGTLNIAIPGQNDFFLKDSELVDVDSEGKITSYTAIPFNASQFDHAADSCLSPIQGFNILRRDSKIPQPGKNTFQENIDLPCEPLSNSTVTPEETTCETPAAFVRSDSVQLREGPDLRFLSVGEYQKYDNFTILGRYQEWYKVKFPDRNQGWLYSDWIDIPSNINKEGICKIPYRDLPPTPRHENVCEPSYFVSCP